MNSEALRNIRTMRQVRTSLDIARKQNIKTTNCLSRTTAEMEHPETIEDRRTGQILTKERARVAAYNASIEKSRQRLLKYREKLAAIIKQNRALTELRHELQQARRQEAEPPMPASSPSKKGKALSHRGLREIELKY
jgi:hypothetical protein